MAVCISFGDNQSPRHGPSCARRPGRRFIESPTSILDKTPQRPTVNIVLHAAGMDDGCTPALPERVSIQLVWKGAAYRQRRRRRHRRWVISFRRCRISLTSYAAAAAAVDNIFSLVRHHNVRLILLHGVSKRLLSTGNVDESLLESCADSVQTWTITSRRCIQSKRSVID